MTRRQVLYLIGFLIFLSAGITRAQVNTGTISGTTKDSTGAVLAGAHIVVLNDDTGISRTVEADSSGRYSAPSLALGNYRVTGSREGFQTEVRSGIVLTVGREAVVDLVLAVGSLTQAVEVRGEAPLVESTSASLGSLVDDRTIRALPLNGRSYDQLALLQPGVIASSPGLTASTPFRYGSGKRFSVGGQRPGSNDFLLDGTNINDQGNGTPGGAAGTNLGVDTILEFKIFTNSFKAEYGHSSGSIVSAITRSGTNAIHGTTFEYIRNSALDARNFFDVGSSPPSFKRNQFGGVLGGPIKKDKTFFFGGYEGLRQGLATTLIAIVPTALARQGILPTAVGSASTITIPVNSGIVPYLNLYPFPNGRDFGDGTGQFLSSPNVITNEDNVMARVDHQLNEKTNVFGRYTFDTDSLNSPQSIPNQLQTSASRRQYVTLQTSSILSAKALNSFRFAFNRTHSTFVQNTIPDPGPQVSIIPGQLLGAISVGGINASGARPLTQLGPNTGNGSYAVAFNIFETGDDFSYVVGKHSLKAGVDIQRLRDNAEDANSQRGSYNFATLNSLLAGTPSNLSAAAPLGVPAYNGFRQTEYAVYGQDDYAVTSRLTLNLGLRWEMITDPVEVNGKSAIFPTPAAVATVVSNRFFSVGKRNIEPRVGIAWQLDGRGKTVLRAGGGVYHNQILPYLYEGQSLDPPFSGRFSVSNPSFPNGYLLLPQGNLISPIGNGSINLIANAPFMKTPTSIQYNLSIQREVLKNTVLQVAYAGNSSDHLFTQRETDTTIPTFLPDGQIFFPANTPRLNPAWVGARVYETSGNSVYNSVTVTLRHQSSNGLQGQIFYTFSKAMDTSGGTNNSESVRSPGLIMDPFDRNRDWGLADFDSRNAVVTNLSYPVPFRSGSKVLGTVVNGWTISGIGTFTAGMPFTARLAAAASRDQSSSLAERPNLNPGASQNPNQGISAGCPGFLAGSPLGGATNFYDPCSFSLPTAGTYGNLGRNTIIGPGIADVDLTLEKGFKLKESANVTFRAEMFNIMNHTNLGLPNSTALATSGAASPSAGVVTYTTTSARQLQFALRLTF